ncbi:UDP:flavonoid glycosyltransferase YjiC (YdhE family) [Deinococcus metalli]|uniref:Glycosyl transferase n=1 Tax=Deinococcus metalli TaxID=1141878 RepID=A0A7W8KCT6_9DEIO|nr:nucleotide disphospho-sugar-binding domain-containing protein [Deinococcus metalli]MBB5375837.1 UDP:flavonoid glycosyltransferase YjiC (YdhE family) [Deinococcus metalli]GHF36673.1 glycosyl transferase [Deinococcus metalli]
MARILIASQPIAGHLLPLLPVARELAARGHELRWYTGRKYAARVRAAGAAFEPFTLARDYDDRAFGVAFPGRDALSGLRQVQFDTRHIFVGQMLPQLRDLQALHRAWPWEVTLAEQTLSAGLLLEELGGPPCALLGVLPLGIHSRDTAPFGPGLPPMRGPLGRARNAALRRVTQRVVFGGADRDLRAVCRSLGIPERPFEPPIPPTLLLQASVPGVEYAVSDRPPQLHFIGALTPPAPPGAALPDWWPDVQRADRPVVVVTQGTIATDPRDLILPTVRALADEPVLVVAAGVRDPAALGELPANARTAPFLPFDRMLPHASVYVTNGGYGGVQLALSHGLPVLSAGTTEDKLEVGRRVQVAGVGLRLGTRTPAPGAVRRAVRRLLREPRFRERAQTLRAEFRAHDAPREAADLIEGLLQGR